MTKDDVEQLKAEVWAQVVIARARDTREMDMVVALADETVRAFAARFKEK